MVELPQVSRTLVTTQAPTSPITPGAIVAPYASLASAMDKLGGALEEKGVDIAKEAGKSAVTQDADGNLSVQQLPPLFGKAAEAFNRTAQLSYLGQIEPRIKDQVAAKRIEFDGQPQKFAEWADGYTSQLASGQPSVELENSVRQLSERYTSATYQGLALALHSQAVATHRDVIQSTIAQRDNELGQLADQAGTRSDAYRGRLADYLQLQRQAINDPSLNYSAEKAALDYQDMVARHSALAVIGNVRRIAEDKTVNEAGQPNGGAAKAEQEAEKIRSDPAYAVLTPEQREQLFHRATATIRVLEAERKRDLGEARRSASDAVYGSQHGVFVDQDTEESITQTLRASGGTADAARFTASMVRARSLVDFNKLPMPEMGDAIRTYYQGTGAAASPEVKAAITEASAATGVPASYLFRTAAKESSFNPAANSSTSSAGGLFQFTGATWRDTLAKHGSQYGLSSSTSKTDARANALMAAEFTKDNSKALTDAGIPVSEGSLYVAHFAGAEGAKKLYSAPAGASAASILPDAAAANRSLFYDQGGRERSVGETIGRLTNGFAGAHPGVSAAPGTDLKLLAGMQKAADNKAREAWAAITADMEKGVRPADGVINQVVDVARIAGDHDLLETIGARVDRFNATQNAGRQPLAVQDALNTELKRTGAEGGLAPGQSAWLQDLVNRRASIETGLQNSPVATTVANFGDRVGTPQPLDITNSANMRAGLAARASIVQMAAQNWQVPALSALDSGDVARIRATLDTGKVADKLRIYSDLNTLPAPERAATLAKLGEKGSKAAVEVFAGSLLPEAPEVAVSILHGVGAQEADKRFLPTAGAHAQTYQTAKDTALPVAAFNLAARNSPTGGFAVMSSAVDARYAALSAQAGDTSATLNPQRLTKAAEDITGGILIHNGAPLIAPSRGMSQRSFDGIMAGVTDADVAGMRTGNGAPITADYLRSSAKLHSLSSGRYLVQVNADDGNPKYAAGPDGNPFVLDLRNRAPATPSSVGILPLSFGMPQP